VSLYPFDQVSQQTGVCQELVVCYNGSDFCYTLICWRRVRNKRLFDCHGRYQKGIVLWGNMSFKTAKICLMLFGCRNEHLLNLLFLRAGESHAGFLLGRFAFSGMLCMPFFHQSLCFSQLYNGVLCLSELPFQPCHVPFATLHCC
jgi:hypothetical protein